jgi:hypothetical protein
MVVAGAMGRNGRWLYGVPGASLIDFTQGTNSANEQNVGFSGMPCDYVRICRYGGE